jgi:hypothetical protein
LSDFCHSGADARFQAETKSQTLAVFAVLNSIWDERRAVQTVVGVWMAGSGKMAEADPFLEHGSPFGNPD